MIWMSKGIRAIMSIYDQLSLIISFKRLDIGLCSVYNVNIALCGSGRVSDELFTVSQAASYLQLSDKTIRRLISSHKLAASKVGDRVWRIKISNIEKYLNEHTNGKKGVESK